MANRHLLLLDDDLAFAHTLAFALQFHGWQVTAICDPERACHAVATQAVDIMITDYRMPKQNGLQVVEQLRSIGIEFPVLMLSGSIAAVDRDRAASLGIRVLLPKPCGLEEIREALEKMFQEFPCCKSGDRREHSCPNALLL